MSDIDTQIESLLNEALIVWKQDYPKFDRDGMGSNDTRMAEYFERLEKAKTKAHKAIKTLLIQSKIEELEAIMDFDDEPVHLNFDEEINPITVGERIDQLKEEQSHD